MTCDVVQAPEGKGGSGGVTDDSRDEYDEDEEELMAGLCRRREGGGAIDRFSWRVPESSDRLGRTGMG